jgi:hypothetical protein
MRSSSQLPSIAVAVDKSGDNPEQAVARRPRFYNGN